MIAPHEKLAGTVDAPWSFTYDGRPSSALLPGWKEGKTRETKGPGFLRRTRTLSAPDGLILLEQEVTEFPGTPVVEWLLRFRNPGTRNAPLLESVLPLDVEIPLAAGGIAAVRHSNGCWDAGLGGVGWGTGIGNYAIKEDRLPVGSTLRLANPGGGKTIFSVPFFNLLAGAGGIIGALGWPGRYRIDISRSRETVLRISAGMEGVRLSLHPGEEIRTPLVLVLPWEGSSVDAHNVLRRHVLAHHTPSQDGKPVTVPISHGGWGGMKTSTAVRLVEEIAKQGIGYENFWMDAGWYGADRAVDEFQVFNEEDWFLHAGNWRVNRVPHPAGLKPISDAAHAKGMKYLLWFEVERAVVGTPLTMEHPDWFIGEAATEFMGHSDRPYVRFRLFNFGNPDARQWMTDWISGLIADLGIDIYRQDCNFSLAEFWQAIDTPSRQGIAEIRYGEGLLAFWDGLRSRHPHLILDITQRGDLETMSRALDLTRSDYTVSPDADPIGNQAATLGLAHWRPHFGTCIQTRPGDTYHFRSALAPGIAFSPFNVGGTREQIGKFTPADFPFAWARAMVDQIKRARPCFLGDYYPLTACTLDRSQWSGYQMHRPDLGEGMVVMMRRPESPLFAGRFRLGGLDAGTDYHFEDADSGKTLRAKGSALTGEGLEIVINEAPGSCLYFYRAIK